MNTRALRIIHLLPFFFVLFLSFQVFGQTPDRVNIVEGKSKVVKTGFAIKKVAIGDPKVCRAVKISEGELLINAQEVGKSNIIIWGSENNKREILVNVVGSDITAEADELKELLKDIEGVSVRIVGRRIVVEGGVFTKGSLEKIEKILTGMPNIINLVELSPVMKKIVKNEILRVLREEGLTAVKVKVGKSKFVLAGKVHGQEAYKRAEKIALAFSPDIMNAIEIDERITVRKPILIEMSLNIMEIAQDVLKDIGVHWNPDGSLGMKGKYSGESGSSPSTSGAISGALDNLLPKMNKIMEDGRGRSLMQQSVITTSGGKANFFVGSQIPVPVAQGTGTMSVEYRNVGVTLNFSPTLDIRNNINSTVKIESSSVSGEGPGGAPIISTSQLDTMVSIKNGSSIALAGLIGQRELKLISASPSGGGESLYQANKGERLSMDETQIVIFITPRVLSGSKTAVRKMGDRVEESFKKQELENLRRQMKKNEAVR